MNSNIDICIRLIRSDDPSKIYNAFKTQGWNKPTEQFNKYLLEQKNNEREVLIAEVNNEFAGYTTIIWNSAYEYFRNNNIPEISDLNVLIKYRQKGIGNKLLDETEKIVKDRSNFAGIGVGLFSDYGAAQKIYVKRGYVPDGKGIYKNGNYIKYNDTITIDDDVVLYFIKELF